MRHILDQFRLGAEPISWLRYGSGHINHTYRIETAGGGAYILQRINTHVFKDPDALMNNIRLVTDHLSTKVSSSREVLTLVPTMDGGDYISIGGDCWRVYEFSPGIICIDEVDSPARFAESARALGRFFNQLSDFDATKLSYTIPDFHNTPKRFRSLMDAIHKDIAGRVSSAGPEIEAALSQEAFAQTFMDLERSGALPLRVTHNDTKINNVLFDQATGSAVCVIDLDTVMPGHIMNDFGDSIRFGASTVCEDEPDYHRAALNMELYQAYLESYLTQCGTSLTRTEIELLPAGAKMMTYECGIRFLTDYLSGDVYFHTSDPEQNLRRARTQLKLVQDMDFRWDEMQRILLNTASRYL